MKTYELEWNDKTHILASVIGTLNLNEINTLLSCCEARLMDLALAAALTFKHGDSVVWYERKTNGQVYRKAGMFLDCDDFGTARILTSAGGTLYPAAYLLEKES